MSLVGVVIKVVYRVVVNHNCARTFKPSEFAKKLVLIHDWVVHGYDYKHL